MGLQKLTVFNRTAWRYPTLYTALRRTKLAAKKLSTKNGVGSSAWLGRPEFGQIDSILASPESQRLLRTKGSGGRVLCFTLRGAWTTHTAWETVIALGLRLRGASPTFVTCAGALPACGVTRGGRQLCSSCYPYLLDFTQPFRLPIRVLRGMVTEQATQRPFRDIEGLGEQDLLDYGYGDLNLGRMVLPSVRWSLRRGTLTYSDHTLAVYRSYLKSAVIVTETCKKLLDTQDFDAVFCLNGEFFAEDILLTIARGRGIRVVTYERGQRPDTLFFQHNGPACKYDLDVHWERLAAIPLDDQENRRLDEYMAKRHHGVVKGVGGIDFWPEIKSDEAAVREALGLDTVRPVVTMFTNTPFDTATQRKDIAFPDMFSWLESTIRHFASHAEWQLVVRVHPSEVRDVGRESLEPVVERIATAFPQLPSNVHVVPPESSLSSYTLMRLSGVGLVYTSTPGLEMALMGKTSILAGKAHYRGKGFTQDASSPDDYFTRLDCCMASGGRLEGAQIDLARRYSNLFFFHAMIPFDLVTEPGRGQVKLHFDNLSCLLPGRNKALDLICDGILDGRDFLV